MAKAEVLSFRHKVASLWKESLLLLVNKQFWLVTLKATKETYSMLLKKFWWLIIGYLMLNGIPLFLKPSLIHNKLFLIASGMFWSFIVYMTLLIVRPSLYKKNYEYFSRYAFYYLLFSAISVVFFRSNHNFSPFLTLLSFFYLDSNKKFWAIITSLNRAIKMVLYTLPFCLVSCLFFFLLTIVCCVAVGTAFYMASAMNNFGLVATVVNNLIRCLMPLFLCLMNNLYSKQVHDHYDLYYTKLKGTR